MCGRSQTAIRGKWKPLPACYCPLLTLKGETVKQLALMAAACVLLLSPAVYAAGTCQAQAETVKAFAMFRQQGKSLQDVVRVIDSGKPNAAEKKAELWLAKVVYSGKARDPQVVREGFLVACHRAFWTRDPEGLAKHVQTITHDCGSFAKAAIAIAEFRGKGLTENEALHMIDRFDPSDKERASYAWMVNVVYTGAPRDPVGVGKGAAVACMRMANDGRMTTPSTAYQP